MDLRTFYRKLSADEREAMATACRTTLGHLRNVVYGKPCGETLAMDIEIFTKGAVPCEVMRPDLIEQWAFLRNSRAVCNEQMVVGVARCCNTDSTGSVATNIQGAS